MRAYEGQLSDAAPTSRNRDQKRLQRRDLREVLAAMKPHTAASLRASVTAKIAALEAELGVASSVSSAASTPPQPTAARAASSLPAPRPTVRIALPGRQVSARQAPPRGETAMSAAFEAARAQRSAATGGVVAKLGG
jgi:hypothetical protein